MKFDQNRFKMFGLIRATNREKVQKPRRHLSLKAVDVKEEKTDTNIQGGPEKCLFFVRTSSNLD